MLKIYTCEYSVFAQIWWSMLLLLLLKNSWSIGVVVVMRCVSLWIHAMGIHDYGICGETWVVLKILWKMGELVICDGMMFLSQVLYGFECLFMFINV